VKVTEGLTVPLPDTGTGMVSKEALSLIKERIDWADAVVIGPGSGRKKETLKVLRDSIEYCKKLKKPALIDADALFALSENPDFTKELSANFVLTPHHGEFRRLSLHSKEEIQAEPWKCLEKYLSDKKFYVNLKGAPSMVGAPDGQIFVNPTGNAGLAKGGSGDVLAGIIGGFLTRGLSPVEAAITGNFVQGEAADLLFSTYGATSLLPSDLIDVLPEIFDLYE
jgi:NAD(P)H-hydrate epimerase